MQIKAMTAALMVLAPLALPAVAQGVGPVGQMSSSPAGTSMPAPDLPAYGKALTTVLQQLRQAANRMDAKNAPNGANDEQMAHDAVLRQLLQALAVVRTAPLTYRTEAAYKDAESHVKYATQRVEGIHEPASITAPADEAIKAIEGLIQDVSHR